MNTLQLSLFLCQICLFIIIIIIKKSKIQIKLMMTRSKVFRGKNEFTKFLEYKMHWERTPKNSVSVWLENYIY